ncbi:MULTISPECIES: hypothetical protein [Enterococcus]|uniref:Preprotein translocase subunit SecA n=1 Tax=Candidatus Enterococcus ikei TaxID=2815326 RepID=A0ABS3GUQ7_9ENTE|nr:MULTISPECIES: hypothetical protein [Enterococcus]MBO0438993.1 hypothetical protein [Enterococcus sp. DIV0869a]
MGLLGDFMRAAAKEVANELMEIQQKNNEKQVEQEKTEAQLMMSQLSSEEILQVINRPHIKDDYFEAGTMEIEQRLDAHDQLVAQYGEEIVREKQKSFEQLSIEELEKILENQQEFESEIVLFAQFELDNRDVMRMKKEKLPWEI